MFCDIHQQMALFHSYLFNFNFSSNHGKHHFIDVITGFVVGLLIAIYPIQNHWQWHYTGSPKVLNE